MLHDFITKHWAVYAIILRKAGRIPLLYIGSATNATLGSPRRRDDYLKGRSLPHYMKRRPSEGYSITHIAPLLQCPIPAVSLILGFSFFHGFLTVIASGFDEMSHQDCPKSIDAAVQDAVVHDARVLQPDYSSAKVGEESSSGLASSDKACRIATG